MIYCPLCNSTHISFAFENLKGKRYLKCCNCEFIFIEKLNKFELNSIIKNIDLKCFSNIGLVKNIENEIINNDFQYFKFKFLNTEDLTKIDLSCYFSNKSNIIKFLHDRNYYDFTFVLHKNNDFLKFRKRSTSNLKLSIIMPIFNEFSSCKNSIDNILNIKISGLDIELIIVESNSSDGTRDLVKAYSHNSLIQVVYQDSPMGKGNAVREGLNYARGDFVSIHDADDEYCAEDYNFLLAPLINGTTSFVLGNRHYKSWSKIRTFDRQPLMAFILNLGHLFFTKLINLVTKNNLKDPFTMFKIIRRDILSHLNLESNRFDLDHEIVIKLCKLGFNPVEIPISYHSRTFDEGKKVKLISDPLSWIYAILKFGVFNK